MIQKSDSNVIMQSITHKDLNNDVIKENLNAMLSEMENYSEKVEWLNELFGLANMLSTVVYELMSSIKDQNCQEKSELFYETLRKLNQQQTRKQVFTTEEVMNIVSIKSKTTIIKYFKEGRIRATQDEYSKRWTVQRNDLAEYVGHDNF